MANKRITDVDFIESLNSDESFFINQNNAIKQINKSNIVFGVANGGTNATTIEGARANLEVYSKSEIDSTVSEVNSAISEVSSALSDFKTIMSGTITIPTSAWEQNATYGNLFYANMNGAAPHVNTNGESVVFVAPAEYPIENYDAYIENGVRACEQDIETINFIATAKPTVDIIVNYSVM